MKTVEVTLYDIFGYLVPGIVASFGVYLIMRPVLVTVEPCWGTMSATRWTALALVAYLGGHMVQALANVLDRVCRRNAADSVLGEASCTPKAVLESAKARARVVVGITADTDLDARVLFDIMDHYIQQHGKTETRDVLVYREGFYRGLTIAFLLVAVGFFARALGDPASRSLVAGRLAATAQLACLMGVVSVLLCFLSHLRYRRFARHNVKNTLFSFLALGNSVN